VTEPRRLLVISHPAVVDENQRIYARLLELGWSVTVVTPNRWPHEYARGLSMPQVLPALEGRLQTMRMIRSVGPDVAFVEEETFAVAAVQWAVALSHAGVPFGVQADENLDRPLPAPVRFARSWLLRRASFVAARSPRAAELVRCWGGVLPTPIVPHAVPEWELPARRSHETFTVGYAGRLVPEKGVFDLVDAAARLGPSTSVLLCGDGPLREELERRPRVTVRTGVPHAAMPSVFAEMDVLVLPSRTTSVWAEQFGRVLVEALLCGVPVIGSSSGEIPWVIGETGGGVVFPEGDVDSLTSALQRLRDAPAEREALAALGRERSIELFGERAAARALSAALEAASKLRGREGRSTRLRAGVT
jgi:glycosyltransferase involved in cell wall biosynthesis